jgi:ribosomal-protein-alanine N-acetyltransferase
MKIVKINKKFVGENVERLKEIDKVIWDEEGNWTEKKFLKDLKGKWNYSFAIKEEDLVGFAICSLKNKELYIHRFAIAREYQGKNYGSKLLEHILKTCKESGIDSLGLQVKKFNLRAQKFYEKHGFERVRENGPNFEKNPSDGSTSRRHRVRGRWNSPKMGRLRA